MSFHADLASVPAWAPIGHDPAWYRCHLGEPVPDAHGHPSPMAEVLAHHRERWGHIASFDEFLPLLTFSEFDADAWATLVLDAGAGSALVPAKGRDGLCWWDAPGSTRTVVRSGPRRDVLAELVDALRRVDIVVGATYVATGSSGEPSPPNADGDQALALQVLDLVERHRIDLLCGDVDRSAPGPRIERLVEHLRRAHPGLLVDEHWSAAGSVAVYDTVTPDGIVHRPWELRRGVGLGSGRNRAERAEHLLSASEIVALLTEVVAKGGNLRIGVGADADGTITDLQARPLRDAGAWIRRHGETLGACVPWDVWGDHAARYVVSAGRLDAIDVGGLGTFAALGRDAGRIAEVRDADGAPLDWDQDDGALRVRRVDRTPAGLAAVYHVSLEPPAESPIALFDDTPKIDPARLAELLADVRPGAVVQLGEGTYAGPVVIPPGVTVRGLGAHRTVIESAHGAAVTLSDSSRLEHASVSASGPPVAVTGSDATVLGCDIAGPIEVVGRHARLRACRATGVVADGADQVTVTRCHLSGPPDSTAIHLVGGSGHLIDSNELIGHRCSVRLDGTVGAIVRGNVVEATWWGVRLRSTDATTVVGNAVARTARAIDVDGGTSARVEGNAVHDGDSGCVVQAGASDIVVSGNRWERCRIGLLVWDAGVVRHHDNAAIDLHDPDHTVTIGPA